MNTSLSKKLQSFSTEQLEQRKEFTFYCCNKPVVTRSGGGNGAGVVTSPRGDSGGGIPF